MFISHGTEMKFLFSLDLSQFNNKKNEDSIYGGLYKKSKGRVNVYKPDRLPQSNASGTKAISERINKNSFKKPKSGTNPYSSLIANFKNPAIKLKAADFVYLKDLGVYPINRLVILRRYREGVMVPVNLNDWPKGTPPSQRTPISTVVGWFKDGDDKIFDLSFGETWTTEKKMLHDLLGEILTDGFGFKSAKSVPVPGWSQGLLFGFLDAMNMTGKRSGDDIDWDSRKKGTNFDINETPIGNPDVLQEGATRDGQSFGLTSSLDIKLETAYEQKYINNIDPGIAMNDILDNLLRMGTSNIRYVLNGNSEVVKSLLAATNTNTMDSWMNFISTLVSAFVEAIKNIIGEFKKRISGDDDDDNSVDEPLSVVTSSLEGIGDLIKGVAGSILVSIMAKYKWALRGSVALMTGLPSTPWHVTVGNPYMPILSMNNIVASDIKVGYSNQLSFNDTPTNIDVSITCKLGRNMGAQELMAYFNNGYQRNYTSGGGGLGVGTGAVTGGVSGLDKTTKEEIEEKSAFDGVAGLGDSSFLKKFQDKYK